MTLPDRIDFGTNVLRFNARYLFALADGRLHFRPNTPVSGIPGEWKLFGPTGRPRDAYPRRKDLAIREIDCDNDYFLAVLEDGSTYRVTGTLEADASAFRWKESYGWPFDYGPQLKIAKGLHGLCVSSALANSTIYYEDADGNRHERYILHTYALSVADNFIHHNDPWTPGDWEYAFCMPEGGTFVPSTTGLPEASVGMDASAGVVGVIGPAGVYTIEYDFDIAAGNPLVEYTPLPQPRYEGVAPIYRIFEGHKPVRFPPRPWRRHSPIPGRHTGNLQVSPVFDERGGIVPGGESRTLRVLGLERRDGSDVGGYWEKKLTEDAWRFVPSAAFDASRIGARLIDGQKQEYAPSSRRDWEEAKPPRSRPFSARLESFGEHENYFEAATLKLRGEAELAGKELELPVYAHIRMRTSRSEEVGALRLRLRKTWRTVKRHVPKARLGGYLVLDGAPGGELAHEVARWLGNESRAGYERLYLRVKGDRLDLVKPIIAFNADVFDWVNELFGKRLFKFRAR